MTSGVAVGVDRQSWITAESTFDTPVPFVASDAVAPISIELKPTLEYHPSKEHVGTASLQTEVKGKQGGTWSGEWYCKLNALGIPPSATELIRAGMGRIEYDLTVVDYTAGGTETITTTVGGTATVKTNGSDFTAATDNNTTAGLIATELATITGVASATASGAVVTVACDTAPLLMATSDSAFVAITRLGYKLRGQGHTPESLQIGDHVGPTLSASANGCWVEQIEFQITGNDECKVRASGGFASFSQVKGLPQTDGSSYASGATVITLGTGQPGKVIGQPRVYFELASDPTVTVGATAGYAVSSVDLANGTITLGATLGGSGLTAAAYYVRPWVPSQTISGTIQGGIDAGLTIASDTPGFIDYKVAVNLGNHGLDKEANADRANRLARGERSIEGELQMYQLDENAGHTGMAWDGTTQLISARVGPDVSGSRMLLVTPTARMEVAENEIPEAEEATVSVKFIPRQSAAAEDEFRVDLT